MQQENNGAVDNKQAQVVQEQVLEKWVVKSSQPLVTSPWISVFSEVIQIPTPSKKDDGSPSVKIIDPFYYIEEPDWVSIVALTPSNQIVLVRQYRRGCEKVLLELPGGCIDEKEKLQHSSNQDCAANSEETVPSHIRIPVRAGLRELEEETGFQVDWSRPIVDLGSTLPDCNRNSSIAYGYMCHVKSECATVEQQLDENENIHVVLMDASQVYQQICLNRQEAMSPVHIMFLFRAFVHLGQLPGTIQLN